MRDKRTVDELSIEELEVILAIKKREARQARLRSLSQQGRLVGASPEDDRQPIAQPQLHELVADVPAPDLPKTFDTTAEAPHWEDAPALKKAKARARPKSKKPQTVRPLAERRANARQRQRRDQILLYVEVAALVVFLLLVGGVFLQFVSVVQATNASAEAAALPTATPAPEIDVAIVLPGGHTSPNSPGGSQPNLGEIPEHLRPVVQRQWDTPVTLPTPSSASPVSISISTIDINHPIVMGDGPETLKRGVGHHIGSANPGERGNMVLSAHNDIYGEVFRRLDELQAGDEIVVSTMTQSYHYVVRETRVVSPTEVWVMAPTQNATLTLISCYPYMVNTHRIVVFADLVE